MLFNVGDYDQVRVSVASKAETPAGSGKFLENERWKDWFDESQKRPPAVMRIGDVRGREYDFFQCESGTIGQLRFVLCRFVRQMQACRHRGRSNDGESRKQHS